MSTWLSAPSSRVEDRAQLGARDAGERRRMTIDIRGQRRGDCQRQQRRHREEIPDHYLTSPQRLAHFRRFSSDGVFDLLRERLTRDGVDVAVHEAVPWTNSVGAAVGRGNHRDP